MSQHQPSFDESVADAADCYVAHEGSIDAAIDVLVERRESERLGGRVEEAIAYLRYRGAEDEH